MKIPFIVCHNCGKQMLPVWFIDEEAVSYFKCPYCHAVECVDDSLDESWR